MAQPYMVPTPHPDPEPSRPFHPWKRLHTLFLRPTAFFRDLPRGRTDVAVLFAVYVVGISSAIDRIDRMLIKQDLNVASSSSGFLGTITQSWVAFWLVVLVAGALSAALNWLVGGWWYRVRLGWCGVEVADSDEPRQLFTYSHLVAALPAVIYTLVTTVLYVDYASAWEAVDVWALVLLVFPFWGIATSYRGLVQWYAPVRRTRVLIWFIILPAVFFVIAFGLIATLYTLLGIPTPGGGTSSA